MRDSDPGSPAKALEQPFSSTERGLAHNSRVYDHLLGGCHNTAADREVAERLLSAEPRLSELARANRSFLHRAVLYCLRNGCHQFLDLGAGIPTVGSPHDIAARHVPHARVAYVDRDRATVAHSHALLSSESSATTFTRANLHEPDNVLSAPGVAEHLDFTSPVGLLCLGVLDQTRSGQRVRDTLRSYQHRLPAGSLLAFSHLGNDHPMTTLPPSWLWPLYPRTDRALRGILPGTPLEPGLADASRWHAGTGETFLGLRTAVVRLSRNED